MKGEAYLPVVGRPYIERQVILKVLTSGKSEENISLSILL